MMGAQRSISIDEHGDVKVVNLIGEHDLVTVGEVREQLNACASGDGGLVVSLMQTEFFDSSIVHALFTADGQLKERDRRLVLHVATAPIVARVLDVSGLKHQVPCTGSLDEAVALAGRAKAAEWTTE